MKSRSGFRKGSNLSPMSYMRLLGKGIVTNGKPSLPQKTSSLG